ncbi:cyclin-dependent kinase-activating kinase assembly factor-related / CDK-activating kinase assembly factor-like protein [Wolffia australiana]
MVAASGSNPYAKEMAVRRRITNIFNKREEDFPSLREYNDYLEEVEDMTFNLIEGIDVPAIEAKIAQYQIENAEQIIISRARRAEELAASYAASKMPAAQSVDSEPQLSQPSGHYAPTALPGGGFVQPRPIGGAPQPTPVHGDINSVEDEAAQRLRANRAARAGGWTAELTRKRALEEAFSSLCV